MKAPMKNFLLCWVCVLMAATVARADSLDDLARDFWAWRAQEQPVSTDDIPRIERGTEWTPQWSPEVVAGYRKRLVGFEEQWRGMDASGWPVARQVDYRLMGSAIARVRWELEINRGWQRNPAFYVDQTVGAYMHLLLPPGPFGGARSRQIVATLEGIPGTLEGARKNLTEPAAPFGKLAVRQLGDIRPELMKSVSELKPHLEAAEAKRLDAAAEKASAALESYREWVMQKLAAMAAQSGVGREGYVFFLKNVALLPYTPEELLQIGHQEWARSVAFQTYAEHANAGKPEIAVVPSEEAWIALEVKDEAYIRRTLEEKNILTVPPGMKHYTYRAMPGYLKPLEGFGEADDLTSVSRLKEDGIRYINPPTPEAGFFNKTMQEDPRPLIVHEGVPGHYFQLALGWQQPDVIRQHYYDSGANEGIGFYSEEMLQEAGLFDDSPRTREIVASFMRLRALRVEVDVKLALGEFSMEQAAEYMHRTVPMDLQTARGEVALFATSPGQAISYQIGKTQIMDFLAEARRQKGEGFRLREFHDFVWVNGNVPIALQRWEYLGMRDQVARADSLK